MKLFIGLTLLVLLFGQDGFAQKDSVKAGFKKGTAEYYQHQGKTNLKAGFIIAGTGIVLTTAGVIMLQSDIDHSSDKTFFSTGAMLEIIGGLTTISSIPCFVMNFIQKHKASILFKNHSVSPGTSKLNISQPAISIQISI